MGSPLFQWIFGEKMMASTDIDERFKFAAKIAIDEGVTGEMLQDDSPTGPLAEWVRRRCSYRPDTEFYLVFLIGCEIADELARREGYSSSVDRALSITRGRTIKD
jgi:hypothetical protein